MTSSLELTFGTNRYGHPRYDACQEEPQCSQQLTLLCLPRRGEREPAQCPRGGGEGTGSRSSFCHRQQQGDDCCGDRPVRGPEPRRGHEAGAGDRQPEEHGLGARCSGQGLRDQPQAPPRDYLAVASGPAEARV